MRTGVRRDCALAAVLATAIALGMAGVAPAAPADWGIATVAGTGVPGFNGDGGAATAAQLSIPIAVATEPDGGFLIAEGGNHRVRRVLPDGRIVTVAGTGVAGNSGDNGPATAAQLMYPRGLALMPDGGFLVTDRDAAVVRRVFPDGTITTVAGTGVTGFSGDNGPATAAQLNLPYGATPLRTGGFLIADRGNHAVRRVDAAGRITTVAGTPPAGGFGQDGVPATSTPVNAPCAVVALDDGSFYIPDRDNNRVRRVGADGIITTVAGNGAGGDSGDGGPATAASVTNPYGLAVLADGTLVIGERNGNRIRTVSPGGTIATIAGNGAGGFNGDGVPAIAQELNDPVGLAVTPNGGVLVADEANARVRLLAPAAIVAAVPPVAAGAAPALVPPAGAGGASPTAKAAPFRVALRTVVVTRRSLRLRFTLSRAARVRVVLRRGSRRVVLRRTLAGHAGVNAVTLKVRLRPGRYTMRMVANGVTLRKSVRLR